MPITSPIPKNNIPYPTITPIPSVIIETITYTNIDVDTKTQSSTIQIQQPTQLKTIKQVQNKYPNQTITQWDKSSATTQQQLYGELVVLDREDKEQLK